MRAMRDISLNAAMALVVGVTAVVAVSLYTAGQYVVGRERIVSGLEAEGRHQAASLAASVAPYVQAYAVSEYANLVANAMTAPAIQAIIVRDRNMAAILGEAVHVSGWLRDDDGAVVAFDPANDRHTALVDHCALVFEAALPSLEAEPLGSVAVCLSDTALQAQLEGHTRDSAMVGLVTALPIVAVVLLTLHLLVLRPVRRAADAVADRDAIGLPRRPIPEGGARELRALSQALNHTVAMTRASRHDLEAQHAEVVRQQTMLTESERQLREILWATGVGTWEWNVQTGETRFNDRWAEICGYTLRDLEPSSIKVWERLVHPDDARRSQEALERVFAREEETYSCEARMRHRDGHWVWILDQGRVVEWDDEGRPLRMSGTHLDISARKAREAELARLLRLNQDILDAAGEGIFGVDTSGTITFVNRAAAAILGHEPAALVGRQAHEAFHHHRADGSVYPAGDCPTCAAYGLGQTTRVEGDAFWRRDGGMVTVDFVATPIVDAGGQTRGAVVVFRDVTEMRDQQARLRKLSQAVEQSPVSVLITDRDGAIEYVNRTFEQVTGYTFAEVKGQNPRILQSGQKSREEYAALWDTILGGASWSGEFQNKRKDGTVFWELATIAPVVDDAGRIVNFIGVKEDITERKAMEEALKRSNEELEQFAYAASHDLRQPLRMVASYTGLLERTLGEAATDRARDFMAQVKNGALRMDQMLTALLEYSRVGRMGEPIAPVNSGDLVAEAIGFLAPQIKERRAEIILPDTWPVIEASRNEGVRLFQNLLGNALKYCPADQPPRITVAVHARPKGWEFTIADNGIGIDPAQIDRLFKVFQRLHAADAFEGTGVGLAVCRRIMDRHGGRIWVESAGEGHGATFHLLFPAPPVPSTEARRKTSASAPA